MKRRASTETQRAPANSLSVTALTKDVQIGGRAKKHKSRQTLLEEADAKAMAAKAEKEARRAEARREKAEAAKAKARAKDNLLKTFTCPLTHALFLDPVQLADGYSYERSAVRAYQRSLSAGQYPGVSPLTKKPLANRNMVPNTALRQTIAHAVEAGIITGDLVDEYKEGLEKLAQDAATLAKLREGVDRRDPVALTDMGIALRWGWYGLDVQADAAVSNFKLATELGNQTAMAHYGNMLLWGVGTPQRSSLAAAHIGMAAAHGSEYGCTMMADAFANGRLDFPIRKTQAVFWYEKAEACTIKDAPDEQRNMCETYLAAERAEREADRADEEAAEAEREVTRFGDGVPPDVLVIDTDADDSDDDNDPGPTSPSYSPTSPPRYSPDADA